MERKYTIRDIAEMAGVSKGTVDRVLHKRGKVSETALEKVNKILEEIDFKPNPIAKNLKNNKMYRLCILLPNIEKDPYWLPCVEGIKQAEIEFQNFGIKIEQCFFDSDSTESYTSMAMKVINSSPDAILMVPLFSKEAQQIAKTCEASGILVSTFNNFIESNFVKNFIGQDLFQSGRVAAKLLDVLLKNGHIAIVHIDEDYHNATHLQEKEKGFRSYFEELKNNNYKITTVNLTHEKSLDFKNSIHNFLDDNPDINGIFVTLSKSYVLVDALNERVDNLSIVGYDLVSKNIEHLKSGAIDFLIHQNPKQQVYRGLSYLAEYFLFDKEIPSQLLLPIDIINSENFKQYMV